MVTLPQQRRFATWGTYVHLETDDHHTEAEHLTRDFLDDVDRACSRFRPDSDLSAVNRSPGRWVPVSPLLIEATLAALAAARVSNGLVDPLLGRALVDLGYDADFATLRTRTTVPTGAARLNAWHEVKVDAAGSALRIPSDTALDLGATCKAWAADVLATTIAAELGTSALISLGGDIRACSPPGVERTWAVRITETPDGTSDRLPAEEVLIDGGGLATSSTTVRRWRTGAGELHHVLDPRTGRPTTGPWRTVTATGPTCVAANVATTSALILGDTAPAWLARHDVDARLVSDSGRIRTTGGWPSSATEEAAAG